MCRQDPGGRGLNKPKPTRRPPGQGVRLRGPIAGLTAIPGNADSPDPLGATVLGDADAHLAPDLPDDLVAVGRIVDAYGIRGWVKVEAYNDAPDSVLARVRRWWIQRKPKAGVAAAELEPPRLCDIDRVRSQGSLLVAKPRLSDDRDQAIALKGVEVLASRRDFPVGEEGEYYWRDLVGCEVSHTDAQPLGRVFAVEDYGAHPILRLKDSAGVERMIPFISVYIIRVDLAARSIVADWAPDY